MFEDCFIKHNEKNTNGTLTVGEALINKYYRLRNGSRAGRVIIRTCAKIDNESVCFFANRLTWIFTDKIKDILCEEVHPTFSDGIHPIDRSQATWYPDNSTEPMFHTW